MIRVRKRNGKIRQTSILSAKGKYPRLILPLVVMLFFFMAGMANSAEAPSPKPSPPSVHAEEDALSLKKCIEIVLVQSPFMKLHDLKIEIKGLDADDAWYQMFPKINLALNSNLPIIEGDNPSSSSFTASLNTGAYDPITAKISHTAQLKLTELAKYAKLETAAELIKNTAAAYLREKAHAERMAHLDELLILARDNLAFVSKSYPEAPTVPLDVRLAEHNINLLEAEKARLRNTRTNELMRLKRLIGIPAEQKIQLQATEVEENLFRTFEPSRLSFEQVRRNSIKEKMARLSAELAENNIIAAWAKYIPKFSFSVRTPDPVNNDGSKDDSYYLTIGVTAPLWHWGELSRGRDRARFQKKQTLIRTQADWLEFEDRWYTTRSNVQLLKDGQVLDEKTLPLPHSIQSLYK